jgi:hypothetical protein
MNKSWKAGFILFLLIKGLFVYAQANDAGLWISANVDKRLSQSVGMSFSEELRLMENFSEAATIFSDLGLEYRFGKKLKASVHYRFLNDRRLDDTYASWNRLYLDVSYKDKLKPFVISIRERIQSQFSDFLSSEGIEPEYYSRTKIASKLNLNTKLAPYLSAELFHPLNNPAARFIDKVRYSAGVEYPITSRHMIDLSYMIQRSYHSVPGNDFVIVVGYNLSL